MASITFLVPGEPSSAGTRGGRPSAEAPTTRKGIVKHAVRVGARRGEGGTVRVTATPGQDVVVLHIENGPSLVLHPENARDLILAQKDAAATSRGAHGAASGTAEEVEVPGTLQWRVAETATSTRGATRGRLGDVILRGLDVVTDAAKEFAGDFITGKVQSLAASTLVSRVDDQVEEGVYRLNRKTLPRLKAGGERVDSVLASESEPALVLVHGTFSNTNGTFVKLWTEHGDRVERLFKHYNERVYALDHRTLGASPIANALTLVRTLPKHARLHVVTHSRGGLVGEVLARACGGATPRLDLFAGDEYEQHREEVAELYDRCSALDIQLERLVRVACPARGTLLASKRLDAYLSILKWSLELAGVPVLPEVVDFLNGVAQYRADPRAIPGLAAQIPDNPLVRWLHETEAPIKGDLRVVAGDLAGNTVTSWLKTLLADAFYWTDNDLVVQTRSMYGGTPRAASSTFVLDRGGNVSHFAYFANAQTAGAIVDALIEPSPKAFQAIGPLSHAGADASGTRAAQEAADATANKAERPAVILVPGIFGSHLHDRQGRVWLDWRAPDSLRRLSMSAPDITVGGLVEDFYGELSRFLSQSHDVIEFPYDWRQPLRTSAAALARTLSGALRDREATGQPVRILSHSSGGLVVRALHLVDRDLWKRWLENPGARLLMLGPPNAGWWMPMQLLSGDETLGGLLALATAPFREHEARQVLAECPGFVELQAGLLNDRLQLARESGWRELAYDDVRRVTESSTWHRDHLQRQTIEWGVPPQARLDDAVALHQELNRQRGELGESASQMLIAVGRDTLTPLGFEAGEGGLEYLYTAEGDGYVTDASAALPGVTTWIVDGGHLALSSTRKSFDAYLEMLESGRTGHLSTATVRGGRDKRTAEAVRLRPSRLPKPVVPPASNRGLFGPADEPTASTELETLRVTIVNGDLSFVRQPLLLGHYRSSKLTGAERVVNSLIGGAMLISLQKGHYPDSADSHQVFINTRVPPGDLRRLPRPEAVVVVGLGEEGKLQPAHLVRTVKHGVIAWAQRVSERPGAPSTFELAATLIGSGGIGMTVAQSAQLIVQGVREANETLASDGMGADGDRRWPHVSHLSLIELYLDRAAEAWRALRMTLEGDQCPYRLDEVIEGAPGALPRPIDSSYRGADYDFIRAATQVGPEGESIAYTLDTKRARTETRAQPLQEALLKSLIGQAADDRSQDLQIRRTLFRLLVPTDLEPFMTGKTELQLELDSGTAGIPWELLDDSPSERLQDRGAIGAEPWAIRTKLLRKLRTAEFRAQVTDADGDGDVLVIGEPECDPAIYPPLIGAQREALAVRDALVSVGGLHEDKVVALTSLGDGTPSGPNARAVITALMQRDWRIIHIAAHGEPPEPPGGAARRGDAVSPLGNPRGVVLSDGVFLGPREINAMRTVPELVFVNCCYLAASDVRRLFTKEQLDCEPHYRNDRPKFASGVAEALIKVGVRCVIAAGWAVEDKQAMVFARTFYEELLKGRRFIDAVAVAREATWHLGGNTWAAYQCYGDADWVFRRGVSDAQRPAERVSDPDSTIASPRGLILALQTIAVECEYQKKPKAAALERIERLEVRFKKRWGGLGRVAESFATAYAKAGDDQSAVKWYSRALSANDGGASVKATEQLANLRVRLAWKQVEDVITAQERDKSAGLAAGDTQFAEAVARARPQLQDAITFLEKLLAIRKTSERASLLGSAHKRLAMIAAREGNEAAERAAIDAMRHHYEQAERLDDDNGASIFYPALNRLAAEFALGQTVVLDPTHMARIRADLDAAVRDRPEFWSVVGQTELRLYEALARGDLASEVQTVLAAYDDLYLRIQTASMWSSVYDQAQFVLPKYGRTASEAERQAVRRILERLAELSGRPYGDWLIPVDSSAPRQQPAPKPAAKKPAKPGVRKRDR